MTAKRRTRRRRNQPGPLESIAGAVLRPEVAGLGLVLIAAFTLLSLITGSRGQVTGAWIDLLRDLVGVGVWSLALVMGVLGLWAVIRAIERMPDQPWQRPAGVALLFLAYITGATLWTHGDPLLGGGRLGTWLADTLTGVLGVWGAWAVVAFVAVIGLVLLTDRLLIDGVSALAYTLQGWARGIQDHPAVQLQPGLPIPSGQLPWWKRMRERFFGPPEADADALSWSAGKPLPPAPNLVRPAPGDSRQGESVPNPAKNGQGAPAATRAAVAGAAAANVARTTPKEGELLTPRIVGGAQEWRLPRLPDMLRDWERQVDSDEVIRRQGRLIQETLALFGVPADFEGAYKGPSVTQYLVKPGYTERTVRGETQRVKVKVSKISGLANDLALALAASSVRIEAPIPGTNYVGVEVPNSESNTVGLKEMMESESFQQMKGKLRFALGEDVKGQPIVSDLARMPHLLIAGATGSGKSVCINSIVTSLLCTHTPDTLRMLMVDPKMVELSVYNGVPHLLSPVVTDVDRAAGVLFWAVKEMERRYQLCSKANARDLERYNAFLAKRNEKPLPYIVIIVDEMADLMMAAPEEVEKHICRLAQMARAVGMHLIIATQRPSVDVITGLIKANFPARIAFAVSSQVDSRVILDVPGAERLLGRGDMLFTGADSARLERIQGVYVSDEEINRIVRYWKGIKTLDDQVSGQTEGGADGDDLPLPTMEESAALPDSGMDALDSEPAVGVPVPAENKSAQPPLFRQIDEMKSEDGRDDLFEEAQRIVEEAGRGSVSLLQRKLRIGYGRASRLVEQLEAAGVLGPDLGGSQGRTLLKGGASNQPEPPGLPPHIVGSVGLDETGDDSPARPRVWM